MNKRLLNILGNLFVFTFTLAKWVFIVVMVCLAIALLPVFVPLLAVVSLYYLRNRSERQQDERTN